MHITENDGSYRTIKLDGHSKDYLLDPTENQKKIHIELKKYLDEGFKIIEHAKGGDNVILWTEDYILFKE